MIRRAPVPKSIQNAIFIAGLSLLGSNLAGCLGSVWSGASAVYNRHHLYERLSDARLSVDVNDVLAVGRIFNNSDSVIDIAVFNGDILLAGHVPSQELFDELVRRIQQVRGYKRLFNKITVKRIPSNSIQDSWITTKIRSQIFSDSSIDPKSFKIVTSDQIVYLMGDVTLDQAKKVIKIARNVDGVERVVTLLRYFTYQSKTS